MLNAYEAAQRAWAKVHGNEPSPIHEKLVNNVWQKIKDAVQIGQFTTFYNHMTLEEFEYVDRYFKNWGYRTDGGQKFSSGFQVHIFW